MTKIMHYHTPPHLTSDCSWQWHFPVDPPSIPISINYVKLSHSRGRKEGPNNFSATIMFYKQDQLLMHECILAITKLNYSHSNQKSFRKLLEILFNHFQPGEHQQFFYGLQKSPFFEWWHTNLYCQIFLLYMRSFQTHSWLHLTE